MSSKGKQQLKKLIASLEESRVNGQDTAQGERLNISAVDFHTTLASLQDLLNRIYNITYVDNLDASPTVIVAISESRQMQQIRECLRRINNILPILNKSIDSILKESDHLKTQATQFAYLAGSRMGRTTQTIAQVSEMLDRFQQQLEEQTEPRPNSFGAPYFYE